MKIIDETLVHRSRWASLAPMSPFPYFEQLLSCFNRLPSWSLEQQGEWGEGGCLSCVWLLCGYVCAVQSQSFSQPCHFSSLNDSPVPVLPARVLDEDSCRAYYTSHSYAVSLCQSHRSLRMINQLNSQVPEHCSEGPEVHVIYIHTQSSNLQSHNYTYTHSSKVSIHTSLPFRVYSYFPLLAYSARDIRSASHLLNLHFRNHHLHRYLSSRIASV